MKTINELLTEASAIADKRTKMFNELSTGITNTLIPALRKVMHGYGIGACYISMSNKPYANSKGFTGECEREYGIRFASEEITEARYNYCGEGWQECDNTLDGNPLKVASIELAEKILSRIDMLNTQYAKKNEIASGLIDKINAL